MSKLPKETIDKLQGLLNFNCSYAELHDEVSNLANDVLEKLGAECELNAAVLMTPDFNDVCSLDIFVAAFWDKAVLTIMEELEKDCTCCDED